MLLAVVLLCGCPKNPSEPPKPKVVTSGPASIAWKHASSDAEVDAAFAVARDERKPVFVYWGAKWCPPCNQVKATLFNRHDFIERSRAFVPVYIDGDSPGAQKLGARFNVRGYPTMVLFSADGAELTRLPGEVDAAQYTQVLTLGMNAQRPVKAVLADALAGGRDLTPNDWKLLAFYAWDTDEQSLVSKKEQMPGLLGKLAALCPPGLPDTTTRLLLKSLAASEESPSVQPDTAVRQRVLSVLADGAQSRLYMDVLTNNAVELTRALSLPHTPERAQWLQAFDLALKGLTLDGALSRADRVGAMLARVDLVGIDAPISRAPMLPESLLVDVRAQVAHVDSEITNGYERQAVITTAATVLERAGLVAESDALLKANLARSHSPYYLMSALASNAKKRGDKTDALHWYEEAFSRSEGPATRLQWGASYVVALVDLSPQDAPRIERAVQQVFKEAALQPNAFYERSARSLQRVGQKLQEWPPNPARAAVLKRLRGQLSKVCAALPPGDTQQDICAHLLDVPLAPV